MEVTYYRHTCIKNQEQGFRIITLSAECNTVYIRALRAHLGDAQGSELCQAALGQPRLAPGQCGNSVFVCHSSRGGCDSPRAKMQPRPSVQDVKPLGWGGRACRFVTLLLSLCCVEFKCLTLTTKPQTCWNLTG